MKKIITLLFLCYTFSASAHIGEGSLSATKIITIGSKSREYVVYTPKDYNTMQTAGLLVCLHGMNQNMSIFFDECDITALADRLNMVIVSPNALPEQDSTIITQLTPLISLSGMSMSFDAIWGAGLGINIPIIPIFLPSGIDVELNKDVDDVSFIDSIIDQTLTDLSKINSQNIFVSGVSLGGYMAYQYAMTKGDRLAGLISIAGTMGTKIDSRTAVKKIPICDFHSETDEVVPYTGISNITTPISINITFGTSKTTVINNWVDFNQASTTPDLHTFPNANGKSVTKQTYQGNAEVIHYKITGANHTYFFQSGNQDAIDYYNEIYAFIKPHLTYNLGIRVLKADIISVYPNPAHEKIYTGLSEGKMSIYDISGKKVLCTTKIQNGVTISALAKGLYIVSIETKRNVLTSKFYKE